MGAKAWDSEASAEHEAAVGLGDPARTDDLPARDRKIVRLRWEGRTLDEIGHEVGLTRERVRQILVKRNGPTSAEVRAVLEERRDAEEAGHRESIRSWLQDNGPARTEEVASALALDAETVSRLWPQELQSFRVHTQTGVRKWTKTEVLSAIQCAATYEHPLRRSKYDELIEIGEVSGPKSVRVMQVFGTWRRACDLADIESVAPHRQSYNSTWTDDDLWGFVVDYLNNSSRAGTFDDFGNWLRGVDGAPSPGTVRNRLGQWNDVKAAVGRRSR